MGGLVARTGCCWVHVETLLTAVLVAACTRGVASVVAMAMTLLGIAFASCKAFSKSLIDFMRLAAFEMKTEFASFHFGVDTAMIMYALIW